MNKRSAKGSASSKINYRLIAIAFGVITVLVIIISLVFGQDERHQQALAAQIPWEWSLDGCTVYRLNDIDFVSSEYGGGSLAMWMDIGIPFASGGEMVSRFQTMERFDLIQNMEDRDINPNFAAGLVWDITSSYYSGEDVYSGLLLEQEVNTVYAICGVRLSIDRGGLFAAIRDGMERNLVSDDTFYTVVDGLKVLTIGENEAEFFEWLGPNFSTTTLPEGCSYQKWDWHIEPTVCQLFFVHELSLQGFLGPRNLGIPRVIEQATIMQNG